MRGIARRLGAALLVLALTTPRAAGATPADDHVVDPAVQANAERLFEEGKTLLAAEDWKSACALFDASAKLVDAVPALVKVARCEAHEGRRAKAIEVYERALAQKPWPELERLVRAELFEMQQHTPSIRITLVEPAAGVTVRRNERLLPSDAIHARLWTDVGVAEHLEVEAKGYRSASFDVAATSEEQIIDIRVALVREAKPSPPPRPPPADLQRPIGWAIAGGGGLALVLAGAFGIEYLVRRRSVFGQCVATLADGRHVCPASTSDRYDAAVGARMRAEIMLGVGGALAVTGVVLVVVPSKRREVPPRSGDRRASTDPGWTTPKARETADHSPDLFAVMGPSGVVLGGVF